MEEAGNNDDYLRHNLIRVDGGDHQDPYLSNFREKETCGNPPFQATAFHLFNEVQHQQSIARLDGHNEKQLHRKNVTEVRGTPDVLGLKTEHKINDEQRLSSATNTQWGANSSSLIRTSREFL